MASGLTVTSNLFRMSEWGGKMELRVHTRKIEFGVAINVAQKNMIAFWALHKVLGRMALLWAKSDIFDTSSRCEYYCTVTQPTNTTVNPNHPVRPSVLVTYLPESWVAMLRGFISSSNAFWPTLPHISHHPNWRDLGGRKSRPSLGLGRSAGGQFRLGQNPAESTKHWF